MEREETKKFILAMIVAYPNFKPANMELTVNMWNEMLSEYTESECMVALKTYITTDTTGFAPSIGSIVSTIKKLKEPEIDNEMSAWAKVRKAIGRSGYNSVEEFEKLEPAVQKAVGSPNQLYQWAMDTEFNESVVSSNFMRAYKQVVEREKWIGNLPKEARALIGQTVQMMIGEEK